MAEQTSDPRATPEAVLGELGWDDDPNYTAADVESEIGDAHLLVQSRLGDAVADVDAQTLTRMEELIACYFAANDDAGLTRGSVVREKQAADVTKRYNVDHLTGKANGALVSYWDRACGIDPTGLLDGDPDDGDSDAGSGDDTREPVFQFEAM